jgi:fidgetin-like protein 1
VKKKFIPPLKKDESKPAAG